MGDVPMGMPAAVGQPATDLMALTSPIIDRPAMHGYYTHERAPIHVENPHMGPSVTNSVARRGAGRVQDVEGAARRLADQYALAMNDRFGGNATPAQMDFFRGVHYLSHGPEGVRREDREDARRWAQARNAATRGGLSEDLRQWQLTDRNPPNRPPASLGKRDRRI